MKKDNQKRIELRFPLSLLKEVDQYKTEESISTRTGAIFELIRIGLKASKSKER